MPPATDHSVRLPKFVWDRANSRARNQGYTSVAKAFTELLRLYGDGTIRVTAWPAHDLAALVEQRIDNIMSSLGAVDSDLVAVANVRQLLADVVPAQLADLVEPRSLDDTGPDDVRRFRCPDDIWAIAARRRAADGFNEYSALVCVLATRYATGLLNLPNRPGTYTARRPASRPSSTSASRAGTIHLYAGQRLQLRSISAPHDTLSLAVDERLCQRHSTKTSRPAAGDARCPACVERATRFGITWPRSPEVTSQRHASPA